MADNALISNEVQTYLDTVGGDYVAAYNQIVADQERKVIAKRIPANAETRKAKYAAAVRNMDRKQLASMAKTVRNFLPLAKANSTITSQTGVLDETEAEDLMVEVLEVKRLQEIAKSRYEEIRKRVFNSITEGLAEQGEKDPEVVPGYIEVPKLKLKFTREGGGFADPELQEDVLQALVGPDVWDKVTTVEVIPAQEVRTLDMDLFLQEARRKPALLEELRKALKVGEPKGFKFHQRAMEPEE